MAETPRSPFGELLLAYMRREFPRLRSYSALAREIGVSHTIVAEWITNAREPSVESLLLVARTTDIPLTTLLHAAGYTELVASTVTTEVFAFIRAHLATTSAVSSERDRAALLSQFDEWEREFSAHTKE